ncbi:MAG: ATP-binding protein [Vicinamibacteria bacterium]
MTPPTVDLSNCDREPIHIPGAVQPHGVLLACRGPAFTIGQASENAHSLLGKPFQELLGAPISRALSAESCALLAEAAAAGFPADANPLALESAAGVLFDGIVHRSGDVVLMELEPRSRSALALNPQMRAGLRRLQQAADRGELYDVAARELRQLTGFDRVMVYRFDAEWNGEVMAEARRADLEPFLGLHYPAADIPAQARRLYTLNWIRIIPDIQYRPARIVPELDPGSGAPLDLSGAVLRSVSPIHVEYLRNMGVTASMSVSLIRDGVLMGLVACHHYSGPHHLPYVVRETSELLGQALSWHIASFEAREAAERSVLAQRAESAVVTALSTAPSIPEGLCVPDLLALTGASGAALVYERRVHLVGRTPAESDVRRILEVATPAEGRSLFACERLGDLLPDAADWEDVSAGVLALEISRELGEFVLWFRPATDRKVDWAGDPRKTATSYDASGAPRLSPRGSFALWREVVAGRSLPWEPWQLQAASDLRRVLVGGIRRRAEELLVLNRQLSDADRMKDDFLATIGHELRTPLNAMMGWLHILKQGDSDDGRRARAIDVIERNARVQTQLVDDLLDVSRIVSGTLRLAVQPVEVAVVVERAIDGARPAAEAKQIRLQSALDSTAVILGDAQRLQQVASNLLANAVKFTPKGGRVQVFVERRDSSVDFTVADTGEGIEPDFLPHVFDRFRQASGGVARRSSGLGLGLAIVRHLVELHGGTASAASEGRGKGASFTVRLPLSVTARRAQVVADVPALDAAPPPQLVGLRVLLVEDEPDAREVLRVLLEKGGARVETAASAEQGLRQLAAFRPDLVVSDVGLPELDGYAFAQRVRGLPVDQGGQTPMIALTAHARVEDRARAFYAGFNLHVPKPVEAIELFAAIASLARRRPSPPES